MMKEGAQGRLGNRIENLLLFSLKVKLYLLSVLTPYNLKSDTCHICQGSRLIRKLLKCYRLPYCTY